MHLGAARHHLAQHDQIARPTYDTVHDARMVIEQNIPWLEAQVEQEKQAKKEGQQ